MKPYRIECSSHHIYYSNVQTKLCENKKKTNIQSLRRAECALQIARMRNKNESIVRTKETEMLYLRFQ